QGHTVRAADPCRGEGGIHDEGAEEQVQPADDHPPGLRARRPPRAPGQDAGRGEHRRAGLLLEGRDVAAEVERDPAGLEADAQAGGAAGHPVPRPAAHPREPAARARRVDQGGEPPARARLNRHHPEGLRPPPPRRGRDALGAATEDVRVKRALYLSQPLTGGPTMGMRYASDQDKAARYLVKTLLEKGGRVHYRHFYDGTEE